MGLHLIPKCTIWVLKQTQLKVIDWPNRPVAVCVIFRGRQCCFMLNVTRPSKAWNGEKIMNFLVFSLSLFCLLATLKLHELHKLMIMFSSNVWDDPENILSFYLSVRKSHSQIWLVAFSALLYLYVFFFFILVISHDCHAYAVVQTVCLKWKCHCYTVLQS